MANGPSVKVKQIRRVNEVAGENALWMEVVLEIDGKRRKYMGYVLDEQQLIEDAYFFHTGNTVDWQLDFAGGRVPVFQSTKADPTLFEHIERVPPWATRPE